MINAICLNKNYSTTKLLTKEKPIIENKSKDRFESVFCFYSREIVGKAKVDLECKGAFKKSYESKPFISVTTVIYNGEKIS